MVEYTPDVWQVEDSYPFGWNIKDRSFTHPSPEETYRFGFNGMEKNPELNEGDQDFGARMYDGRIGRGWGVDALESEYPHLSPYAFVGNMPISAIDPDGRLIIFVNGLWGWPNQVGVGGTMSYWGRNWVRRAQRAIGDRSEPLFYDGFVGGTGDIFGVYGGNNTSSSYRILAGKQQGYSDAETIINRLETNENGEITETIKFVTNSMGAAYERGMSEGILKWVKEENERIDKSNATINKTIDGIDVNPERVTNPVELKARQELVKSLRSQLRPRLNVRVEMVIDLDSHQIDYKDPNAERSYYMLSDWENRNAAEKAVVRPKEVEGAVKLGVNPDGTSRMIRHHSSGAPADEFPSDEDPSN